MPKHDPPPADGVPYESRNRWVMGGALAVIMIAFSPTLAMFHVAWMAQPYTHGYLVALVTAWFVWRERAHLVVAQSVWTPALVMVLCLTMVWLIGAVAHLRLVLLLCMPLLLLAFACVVLTGDARVKVTLIAGIALLAVPFWGVLDRPLQLLAIAANGAILPLVGVPAVIDGNRVTITAGTFLIEGGCAGVSFLLSMVTVAAIYAYLFMRTGRGRTELIALSVVLSIVMNWVRVSSLIVIGYRTDMRSPLMDDHLVFGWALFTVALFIFLFLAPRLERLEMRRSPSADGVPGGRAGERDGPSSTNVARSTGLVVRPIALGTLATCLGPLVYASVSSIPTRPTASGLDAYVRDSDWQVLQPSPDRPFAWQPGYEGADHREVLEWARGGSERIFGERLVYDEQEQGAELIYFTNRIASPEELVRERLVRPATAGGVWAREAVIRTDAGPLLVWYWFRVGGVEATSSVGAKALEVLGFFARRTTAELIVLGSLCEPGDCRAASERLSSLVSPAERSGESGT